MTHGRSTIAILAALLGLIGATHAETGVPPLPQAVSSLGAIVSDGWLYVYGGHTGATHTYSTETASGKLHRINLKEPKTWEELPGGPGLQGMNLAAHAGKIYRVGGMQPRNAPGEKSDNHSVTDAARFDPVAKKWESLPALPEGRSSHDAIVLGDTLYIVGGWTQSGPGKTMWCKTMLTMDLKAAQPEWKSVPQPFERRALTAAAHAGKLYVLGGLTEKGATVRTVDIYDPATGKWAEGPAFPEGDAHGFSPAACSANGMLYLAVGDGTVYGLSPKGDTWEKRFALKTPRIVGRLVTADNRLFMVGGAGKGTNVAEVETLSLAK